MSGLRTFIDLNVDESLSLAAYLGERSEIWQSVVERYDLLPISLEQLLGESHFYADLCFNYGAEEPPAPTYVSTVKIKQAGFTETYDTEASFCYWLEYLQQRRVLPKL